jgi:hypothetical protein
MLYFITLAAIAVFVIWALVDVFKQTGNQK